MSPWLSKGKVCAKWKRLGLLSCVTVHFLVKGSLAELPAEREVMLRLVACFGFFHLYNGHYSSGLSLYLGSYPKRDFFLRKSKKIVILKVCK